MANGNPAGLFRNDNRDRVRFFGNSERGAVTQPETSIERFALAHRKNAGRGGNSPVANDDASIVQRRFRMKNTQEKFDRKIRIERHPGLFVNSNRSVPFDRQQRAELLVRQLSNSFCEIVHGFTFFARQRKNWVATELSQTTAQLRLKNDNQRNRQKNRETTEDPANHYLV